MKYSDKLLSKNLFETEEPKYHIINMTNYLCEFIDKQYKIVITQEFRKQVVDDALEHYKLHVEAYDVPVNGIDPYKFISWIGMGLYTKAIEKYNETVSDSILKSTIIVMNRTLIEEGRMLPKFYLKKIFGMVKNDHIGKEHLGLGKNGLYLVFRSASLCLLEDSKYEIEEDVEIER